MKLLQNIASFVLPILVLAVLVCFLMGSGVYYLSSRDMVYVLGKLFPIRWMNYVYTINEWTALISTIPVLNFFYWVLGVPFMYLVIVPFAWISDFIYNLIDILFINPDYLSSIQHNLGEYPFTNPSIYEPIFPSDWDSWLSSI